MVAPIGEYEFEPVHGLPELLPAGETMLWQGSPQWTGLAVRAYHLRPVVAYFIVLLLWRALVAWQTGEGWSDAAPALALWGLFATIALGILVLFAYLAAKTAVYTITSKRVVMRIGIVLTVSFNLPFTSIAAAGLRSYRDGSGDITLTLTSGNKIAWPHLWPHVRPWRVKQPEPMLRSIPDATAVAELLRRAVTAAKGPAAVDAVPNAATTAAAIERSALTAAH